MSSKRKIDHIVYAVPNLDQALVDFEAKTGITPVFGGYHKNQGTKNALVNIGEGAYLELITIDHENTMITPPRWMGVDLITEAQVTRWSLKSDQLTEDSQALKAFDPQMGAIQGGQRNTAAGDLLSWMMIMPLAKPAVEIAPFVTSWGAESIHPTQHLPQEYPLLEIDFFHPDPVSLADLWLQLELSYPIKPASMPRIKIVLEGPKGRVEL